MDDDVLHATATLAEALARGDAAAAASLYADDGRLLTSASELLSGRAEIEEYWRTGIAFGLSRLELKPIELRVTGRIAIEIGRYAVALDAADVVERGKYVVLHRLQPDGTWRRGVDVFNPHSPGDRKEMS